MSEPASCLLPGCRGPVASGQRLCAAELMPLALVCFGKRRYQPHIAASSTRRRQPASSCYECPVCSRWHVGKTPASEATGVIRAKEVINRLRKAGLAWYVGQLADEWVRELSHRDPAGRWKARMLG